MPSRPDYPPSLALFVLQNAQASLQRAAGTRALQDCGVVTPGHHRLAEPTRHNYLAARALSYLNYRMAWTSSDCQSFWGQDPDEDQDRVEWQAVAAVRFRKLAEALAFPEKALERLDAEVGSISRACLSLVRGNALAEKLKLEMARTPGEASRLVRLEAARWWSASD